jgi:hypothetical protein
MDDRHRDAPGDSERDEHGHFWQPPEERGHVSEAGRKWQEENADAIKAWREWVEKNGLPLAKYRPL